jgi:hypothetical protein
MESQLETHVQFGESEPNRSQPGCQARNLEYLQPHRSTGFCPSNSNSSPTPWKKGKSSQLAGRLSSATAWSARNCSSLLTSSSSMFVN